MPRLEAKSASLLKIGGKQIFAPPPETPACPLERLAPHSCWIVEMGASAASTSSTRLGWGEAARSRPPVPWPLHPRPAASGGVAAMWT